MNDKTQEKPTDPRQPGHPDHQLYQQVETQIRDLNARMGLPFDENAARLAAHMTYKIKSEQSESGVYDVKAIVLSEANGRAKQGEYAIALDSDPSKEYHNRVAARTQDGVSTSVGDSFNALNAHNQTLEQSRGLNQAQTLQREQTERQQGTPGPHVIRA